MSLKLVCDFFDYFFTYESSRIVIKEAAIAAILKGNALKLNWLFVAWKDMPVNMRMWRVRLVPVIHITSNVQWVCTKRLQVRALELLNNGFKFVPFIRSKLAEIGCVAEQRDDSTSEVCLIGQYTYGPVIGSKYLVLKWLITQELTDIAAFHTSDYIIGGDCATKDSKL